MRLIPLLTILAVLLSSAGCGTESRRRDSVPADLPPPAAASTSLEDRTSPQAPEQLTQYRARARSDDAETPEEALFHGVARALVIRHVEPNKLGVRGQEFRVKRNPEGPGCFVYDPRTRFEGVERNLVWLVVDESRAYALNSPTKMVTPTLKWPRDDGISSPSTSEVVGYVFESRPFSPPEVTRSPAQRDGDTFTVAEYGLYRAVIDAPMSVAEAEALRRAATNHGVTVTAAKETVEKVQRVLHRNKWFGSAESEIKHASDWSGQRP